MSLFIRRSRWGGPGGRLFLVGMFLGSLWVRAESPAWPLAGERPADVVALEPLLQPTASGELRSALFGCVRNNGHRFHEGLDLAPVQPRERGEPTDRVLALHEGRVAHVSSDSSKSSYGRYVVLEHEHLRPALYSLYAHLAEISAELKTGDWVPTGTPLGVMGRSAAGYTIPRERAHLHLEVGLRLSDHFQKWYERQEFGSRNEHDNYNGLNLVGLDPVAYLLPEAAALHSERNAFERIEPALVVQVRSSLRPSLLTRSPSLIVPRKLSGSLAGWEITLAAWGLPLSFEPLEEAALAAGMEAGEVRVIAVEPELLSAYACRDIVEMKAGRMVLGRGGQALLALLFEGAQRP